GSVGKTSIRSKFMGVGFNSDYIKTIGADFASKEIDIGENKVHFQIWDLAGQKMYRHVRASFYSGCKCGFLVFDLTQPDTLEKLEIWVEEAIEHSGGFLKIFMILGNKHDLTDQIKVKDSEVKKLLKKLQGIKNIDANYLVTSALTGENINEAFEKMGRMILEKEGFPREGLGYEIDDEILEKHHEEVQSLISVPEALSEPEAESNKAVDISNLEGQEVQNIVKTIMDKITQLTQITVALEERLQLVETKKVSTSTTSADLHELKSKIGNLENQLEKFSIAIEESDRKPIDFPTIDSESTIPVPSMNDLPEESTNQDENFEILDRTLLSTMEVLNDNEEEASIATILDQTEAEIIPEEKEAIIEDVVEEKEVEQKKEVEEVKKEAKTETKKSQNRCPKCGSKLSFIKQYNRWYCYRCKLYV
ncbi:MAG: GTP-binding protein, partial [Asgard group archaeon]|nr:GTP-binding protein [Asgard group archaeon]